VLEYVKSRIRPAFECKECERKDRLLDVKHKSLVEAHNNLYVAESKLAAASAAFAHIGAVPDTECKWCAKWQTCAENVQSNYEIVSARLDRVRAALEGDA
jgi:hypothetical protein